MRIIQKVIAISIVFSLIMTVKSFAMTQNELIEYVCKSHTINGTTYKVNPAYKREMQNYVKDHPITDEQANQIKAKFDSFLEYIDSIGVRKIENTTQSQRQTLLAKANEITAIVEVTVKYNSTDKTIEFYDKNGKKITAIQVSDYNYLVQTGGANYSYVAIPAAIALITLAGVAVFKKKS